MSTQVKFLLPDNLNGVFLRDDFIENGNTYVVAQVNPNSNLDANQVSINFGIQLADYATRLPVDLKTISSIVISNDPNFTPELSVQLSNWPCAASETNTSLWYSNTLDYTINLNPLYFYNPTSEALVQSSTSAPAAGLFGTFTINNWPLSANGGQPTVYLQIQTVSTVGGISVLPNEYQLFAQILWESELPSTPGVPTTQNLPWSGRKTYWQFNASEEPSTGLFSTGIARYLADFVETRYDETINTYDIYCTDLALFIRTIAPQYGGTVNPLVVIDNLSYDPSTGLYGSHTSNFALTSSNPGVGFYSQTISLTSINPDFCAQCYKPLSSISNADCYFELSAAARYSRVSNGNTNYDEVAVQISVPRIGAPVAKIIRYVYGQTNWVKSFTLPIWTKATLLSDGVIELYVDISAAQQDQNMVVSAYFTPIIPGSILTTSIYAEFNTQSIFLGSAIVPVFNSTALSNGVSANITIWIDGSGTQSASIGSGQLTCVAGCFPNALDVGDCLSDDESTSTFPVSSVIVTQTVGSTNGTNGWLTTTNWLSFTEPSAPGAASINIIPPSVSLCGLSLESNVQTDNSRAYAEIECINPTFSDRVQVVFTATHTSGDLYVALSPTPVTTLDPTVPVTTRPMGTRIDASMGTWINEPLFEPTLGIIFSQSQSAIYAVQRLVDTTIRRYKIAPYAPSTTSDTWTITLDQSAAGQEDGVRVSVSHVTVSGSVTTSVLLGTQTFSYKLPTATEGLGWYTAFGVMSDRGFAFSPSDNATNIQPNNGVVVLQSVAIWPLASQMPYSALDAPNQRHLIKATGGNVAFKNLLGQGLVAGSTDQAGFLFSSSLYAPTIFAQRITASNIDSATGIVRPLLLELQARNTFSAANPPLPQIAFIADDNGSPLNSTIDWIDASSLIGDPSITSVLPYGDVHARTGNILPGNNLVQFDLFNLKSSQLPQPVIDAGNPFWILINLPAGCQLAAANAPWLGQVNEIFQFSDGTYFPTTVLDNTDTPTPGTGWSVVTSLWYKLFQKYHKRCDNANHKSLLQTRIRAESHARVPSGASNLSSAVTIDLIAPQPTLTLSSVPSLRSASVNIVATDTDSQILAFRIIRESDYGVVQYGEWRPWSDYVVSTNTVLYTTYLYGAWPLTIPKSTSSASGYTTDTTLYTQDLGFEGARRCWAQVMDHCGNVGESFPITLLAQSMAVVDTAPPVGNVQFVDKSTGDPTLLYNSTIKNGANIPVGQLLLNISDVATSVKDIRVRPLGASSWPSGWFTPSSFVTWQLLNSNNVAAADGIYRAEIQARDFGNNAIQPNPMWTDLYDGFDNNVLFLSMTPFTPSYSSNASSSGGSSSAPTASTTSVYISAINHTAYSSVTIQDSLDQVLGAGAAYYVISTDASTNGREIPLRSSDIITLTINSVTYTQYAPTSPTSPGDGSPNNSFYVDTASGRFILCIPYTGGTTSPISGTISTVSMTISRNSAQLYAWNGASVSKVLDMGYYGEQIITSMLSVNISGSPYLLLGGGSGNLWCFDGEVLTGPITSTVGLPITFLGLHQFRQDSAPYVYLGTSTKPCLYRAPLATANVSTSWSGIALSPTSFLTGTSGSITCGASSYGVLFLGTDSSQILRYNRIPGVSGDTEQVTSSLLINQNLGYSDGSTMPVSSLLAVGGQLFAGIGNRPEIWNYSETWKDTNQSENWSIINFDARFLYDPSPWQFYATGYPTNSRAVSTTSSSSGLPLPVLKSMLISDPAAESGYRQVMSLSALGAGNVTNFTTNTGSDWEEVISLTNNSGIWSAEFEMALLNPASNGYGQQGFQISDGRYFLDVSVSSTGITFTSGQNTYTYAFTQSTTPFVPFSLEEPIIVQAESVAEPIVAKLESVIEPPPPLATIEPSFFSSSMPELLSSPPTITVDILPPIMSLYRCTCNSRDQVVFATLKVIVSDDFWINPSIIAITLQSNMPSGVACVAKNGANSVNFASAGSTLSVMPQDQNTPISIDLDFVIPLAAPDGEYVLPITAQTLRSYNGDVISVFNSANLTLSLTTKPK